MKKVTFLKWRSFATTLLLLSIGLFTQSSLLAQNPGCLPTPGFPDPPASLACAGPEVPRVLFAETFDTGFGVFALDPAPGGTNDLTISTNGDTPSGGTGSECVPEGVSGPEYVFLETSSSQTNETHCMSTVIDLTAETAPLRLSFWYYMYGAGINTLTVNVNAANVFTLSGQQQTGQTDPWLQADVNLDAYAGQVITLQFCMQDGPTFTGDISVDHVQIFGCALPPPIINCPMPDPLIANTDPGVCTAQVTFADAVAIDPDGGPVTVMQTMGPPSGSDFPLGDTIIEFTATDDEGDTATCQFTITVVDNQPPMITCPADITQDSDPGICGAVVNYPSPQVVDNCFMGGGTTTNSLSTLFASNNGGGAGWTVMYDVTVGTNDIDITELEVNTSSTGPVNADVYVLSGGYAGNETNAGAWGAPAGTGSGTGAGTDNPTSIVLAAPITLSANTTYGVAVTMDAGPRYTNGTGCPGNQCFSNSDITIDLGAAVAGLFTGSVFSPRIWNGTLIYEITVSNAPYTVITGFPSGGVFPVGTTLTTLEYTDPGGNSVQCTFNVTVNDVEAPTISCIGQPGSVTDSASDAPAVAIPDNSPAGLSTIISVADDVSITDMNVDLDISHTWVGDLIVTLESPAGTTVTLIDRMGAPPGTFGCSSNDLLITLDDEAASPIEDECQPGPPAASGDFSPNGLLSDFDGESTLGDWILTVSDNAGGDTGTLNSWGLEWTYDDPGTPLDVILDANGMATIPATDLVLGWDDNCGAGNVTISAAGTGGAPMTLPTTLAGGNGNFGNLFDISALNPVVIQSFDIHADTGATFDVEVYAKSGTWVGNETNAAAWTLLTTVPGVVSNGDGVATPLNLTLNYVIPSGETHGFYLRPTDTATGGFNYTNGTGVGNVFTADANIEFLEGGAKQSFTAGTLFQPRVFNGNIHYEAGGASGTMITFTCDDLGETQVVVTATDMAGNESSCTATVNVIDNTPPVLVCMDVTIGVGPNGTTAIEPMDLLAESPTTYDVITISSDGLSGQGFTDLEVTVTTAETVSFDWDYTTNDSPAWDTFGYLLNGAYTVLTNPAGPNDQSGNSGPINLVPGDVFGFRSESVDNGLGPATTTISNFMPGFEGQFDPANWVLTLTNSNGDAFFVEIPGGPLSFDACGITTMAVDIIEVTCDDIANSPLTATVFATDASGNLAACQSMITVVDLLGPEVTCPSDQTVDPGPGNLYYILPDYWATGEATATDNCTDPVVLMSMNPPAGTPLSDGVYTIQVIAEDEYGNIGICEFELTVESILGVDDNALNTAISMYPNPAQEYVTIANGSNIQLDNAMIYDVNGKLISTIDLHNMGSEKVIDVSNLASGVYMVQITSERSSVIKRLLKE